MRPEAQIAVLDAVADKLMDAKKELAKLWRFREECPYDAMMESIKSAIDLATDTESFKTFDAQFEYDREFVVTVTPLTGGDGVVDMYEAIMSEGGQKVAWSVWNPGPEGGAEEWAAEEAKLKNGHVIKFERIGNEAKS